jgi:hypothetical protein
MEYTIKFMRFTNQIMNKKAERRELGFGCCFLLCFCVFVFLCFCVFFCFLFFLCGWFDCYGSNSLAWLNDNMLVYVIKCNQRAEMYYGFMTF